MRIGKWKLRLPRNKEEVVHKGEALFHSTYLGVEAVIGHGPLQWIAGVTFALVILAVLLHQLEGGVH